MNSKEALMSDILQEMLPHLNNSQAERLTLVLRHTLLSFEVTEVKDVREDENEDMVELFLAAKRIEGCSEKSLKYYKSTIRAMLQELDKDVRHIGTEDLRSYLTSYQERKQSSKVTIDNIRRIISGFFSIL